MRPAQQYQELAALLAVDLEACLGPRATAAPLLGSATQIRCMQFYDLCSSARRGIAYGWDMIFDQVWSNHHIDQAPPVNLIMRKLSPAHEAQCFALFQSIYPSTSMAHLALWLFRCGESIENLVTDPDVLLEHNLRWLKEELPPCLIQIGRLEEHAFAELPVWETEGKLALSL